jgi:hypothetical protein
MILIYSDREDKRLRYNLFLTVLIGFPSDQLNSQDDNPNVGTKVYFVSESGREYSCRLFPDGCVETIITCYTPKYVSLEHYYGNKKLFILKILCIIGSSNEIKIDIASRAFCLKSVFRCIFLYIIQSVAKSKETKTVFLPMEPLQFIEIISSNNVIT